jgi:sulfur relay (sulfurtransferase) complex TusBCD TusD component (DsrE family)
MIAHMPYLLEKTAAGVKACFFCGRRKGIKCEDMQVTYSKNLSTTLSIENRLTCQRLQS